MFSITTAARKWRWRWTKTSAQELVSSGEARGVVVRVDLHSSKVEFKADLARGRSSSRVGMTGAAGWRVASSTLTDSELSECRRHLREIRAQASTRSTSQLFRQEGKTTETPYLRKPGVS